MPTVTKTVRPIKPVANIHVSNHGSVFLFAPTSFEAAETLMDLVPPGNEYHYFGNALVVEHRYAEAVAEQLREDGLTVA